MPEPARAARADINGQAFQCGGANAGRADEFVATAQIEKRHARHVMLVAVALPYQALLHWAGEHAVCAALVVTAMRGQISQAPALLRPGRHRLDQRDGTDNGLGAAYGRCRQQNGPRGRKMTLRSMFYIVKYASR